MSKEVRVRIVCNVECPALRIPDVKSESKASFALFRLPQPFYEKAFRGLRIRAPELRDFTISEDNLLCAFLSE